jgi:hypothetical protein
MANKYLRQFQYTFEADTVTLYGSFIAGAVGVVDSFQGGGIASVEKGPGTGEYIITLAQKYSRFLMANTKVVFDSASLVTSIQLLEDPSTLQSDISSTSQIHLQCLAEDGAAENLGEGEMVLFQIVMRNSQIGPFDT